VDDFVKSGSGSVQFNLGPSGLYPPRSIRCDITDAVGNQGAGVGDTCEEAFQIALADFGGIAK